MKTHSQKALQVIKSQYSPGPLAIVMKTTSKLMRNELWHGKELNFIARGSFSYLAKLGHNRGILPAPTLGKFCSRLTTYFLLLKTFIIFYFFQGHFLFICIILCCVYYHYLFHIITLLPPPPIFMITLSSQNTLYQSSFSSLDLKCRSSCFSPDNFLA